jgi:hypothetical protein
VLVDGDVVMRSGRLTKVDEESLIAKFQAVHAGFARSHSRL